MRALQTFGHYLGRALAVGAVAALGFTLVDGLQAAERRVILTNEADYAGFDYSTIRDTDIAACQAACLGDAMCRAFTFNTRAGWCFLKSDFTALSAAAGAIAGRVVDTVEFTPSLERQRLAELNYLRGTLIEESRALVGNLANRYHSDGTGFIDLVAAGRDAGAAGRYDDAAAYFGGALAIAGDDPGLWLDYARASLARNSDDYSTRMDAATDAGAGAVNAYIRAEHDAEKAAALAIAGGGYAKREFWRDAIRAYRASLALVEAPDVRDTYEKLIAERGFRITGHEVEADSANPQICVRFSDQIADWRSDLADFVTVTGGDGLSIEPQAYVICVNGVTHGNRYTLRFRAGLPAADGETLPYPVELSVYVRDRAPWVGFTGTAYVLPAGPGASIPISSVNTDKAKATIYRIGDRSVSEAVRDRTFMQQLSYWSADQIAEGLGAEVWQGEIGLALEMNQTMTTAIPIADALPVIMPGVYVITAQPATGYVEEWGQIATQWFIVSDLGLTVLTGSDGVHAFVRSLSTAEPVADAKLRLIAINNDVLGETTSDAEGAGLFAPGLARGTGGMAPQLVVAETGSDYAFIDLTRAAFDLTDRGVDGRPAPADLDVFLTPERGIYRPGETIYLTALVRNARANAVGDLPLTLVVERPDGVEYLRRTLSDQGLGGYSDAVAIQANAMRGSWRIRLFADPKGNAVAETSVLVEDFEPERLELTVETPDAVFPRYEPIPIEIEARYLYGAPAPGLVAEGEAILRPTDTLAGHRGYRFGLSEEATDTYRDMIDIDGVTDEDGKATFEARLPTGPDTTKPIEATLIVRVADTNGRAIERTLVRPVESAGDMIGIRPLFDGDVEEGTTATFDAILLGPNGAQIAKDGIPWKLERIESNYQWYRSYGSWNYEVITTTSRVGGGTIDFTADATTRIAAPVDWGRYRLTIEDTGGDVPAATSVEFYAGWYVASVSSDTPDTLQVGLDKPAYAIGDTARLRLDPRFAGQALIMVIDDRLIDMKAVDVPEDGTTVDLPVTEAWGPGAYVTAALYRPMDVEAKRMPARALGLTWAEVSPGDRDLDVVLDLPDEMRPRGPMEIPLSIANLAPGEEAYVTVAAVDVGILNLTGFKAPAPDDWYFGRRSLGMEIRDIYGLLIDRMQGVPGTVRSGGDGDMGQLQAPPPTQKLVAYYSGIVRAGEDGKATIVFDLPDFNGTIRVMAMAWSATGVGHAAKDVIVRDPVVIAASIPRFLAIGDTSRLLVEIDNVVGPAGDYVLSVATGEGIDIDGDAERTLTLAEGQRVSVNLPIVGSGVGDFDVHVSLEAPDGESYPMGLMLGVRPPGLPVTERSVVEVAGGATMTLDGGLVGGFYPGTTSVAVSVGGAGPLDVAGILAALDRYPYGCTEQTTSRALPLVYLDQVAVSAGLDTDAAVKERVQDAVFRVLANQSSGGSFGLWSPYDAGADLWLDAYVTDFIVRAAENGYDVPSLARDLALDNLSNRIAYASDFTFGGEDIAYALYVLARTGRAAIGDLRYYADSKLGAFATPLAKAQVGAAIALYGDRQRATRAFEAAMADLDRQEPISGFRRDYGTSLRDEAAVLTMVAESRSDAIDIRELATRIAAKEQAKRYLSTQENAWMLLAAAALIRDAADTDLSVDGDVVASPLFRRFIGDRLAAAPVVIGNLGDRSVEAVVAATGIPTEPEPEGGNGFIIERAYFTPDGEPADVSVVGQNDRFVVVLTVTNTHGFGGRTLIVDPIPAGFEIENPNISSSGDTSSYPWLDTAYAEHTEARTDRFVAALTRRDDSAAEFTVAYTVRAVSPGVFVHPSAMVEDMYRPDLNARSAFGTVEVVGITR